MTTAQALQSLLGSLAVIVALIVQSYVARKFGAKNAEAIHEKIDAVQELVNGNSDKQVARIDQLEQTIQGNGHTIPPREDPPTPATEAA